MQCTQPARLNFVRLEEFWEVLQYNDSNRFMNLQNILNAHPSVLAMYNKYVSDNSLSTDYGQLRKYMTQRLPMGTHAVVNSIATLPDSTPMQIAQLTSSLETIHMQQHEILQRLAELQQIQTKPQQQKNRAKYCFVYDQNNSHWGTNCKVMNNPENKASDGQPYTNGMKQSRDGRATLRADDQSAKQM